MNSIENMKSLIFELKGEWKVNILPRLRLDNFRVNSRDFWVGFFLT